jgi:hypothetical protein
VGEDEDDFGRQGRVVRRKVKKTKGKFSKGVILSSGGSELMVKSLQRLKSIPTLRSGLSIHSMEAMLRFDS